jgi:hypothetical protein
MEVLQRMVMFTLTLFAMSINATAAGSCLNDKSSKASVIGRLSIGSARNAAGQPAKPFILKLPAPTCLTTSEPADKVGTANVIHIFTSVPKVRKKMTLLVGRSVVVYGRPMAAHTAHHYAPIIMEITDIKLR